MIFLWNKEKKFSHNWTSLIESGKIEEHGAISFGHRKGGQFVRNGGSLFNEEIDGDEGHDKEQSNRRADQMEEEKEEEVEEGGGSKSEGFSTSHRNVSCEREG